MSKTTGTEHNGRVLCLAGWWPSPINVAGIFIREHVQAISLHREAVVIYAEVRKGSGLWPRTRLEQTWEDGMEVHRITITTILRRGGVAEWLVRRAYRKLIDRLHRQAPFAILHIHVRTEVTEQALPATAHLDLPVVVTEHNSFYHLGIRALPAALQATQRTAIRQWFMHDRIACVMPVSNDLARVLQNDFGVDGAKVRVTPNVAAACFKPGLRSPEPPFRMVLAAVWRPPKDPDVFIDALRLLPSDVVQRCRVDWVGNGPDLARIQERVRKELPAADIHFPGLLPKEELAKAMQAAHLFVLPTTADNLPCVVLESLCCGTPVLSMAVNGVPELVDHTNGLLVRPGDAEALANALLRCIQGLVRFDHDTIARAAHARYSVSAVGASIEAVYRAISEPEKAPQPIDDGRS